MSKRYSALLELTRARILEFLREPEAVFWTFAFPIFLALGLGFAFRDKAPDKIPVGIVRSTTSETVMKALSNSPSLMVRIYDETGGREALRVGRISLLVETSGGTKFRFDPTRPDSRVARLEANDALQRAAGRRDPVAIGETRVTEPGSRYIDFLLPGLLGLNLMGTGMWGVGFSIVNARTQKLLKRLTATPMRKSEYLLAQMLARLLFLVFEVTLLLGFGWLVFDVAVRGAIVSLAFVCLLSAMSFSGLGLLVASRVQTIEAVSGWMNLVMVPMWLLSGVFFSSERFPDAAQPFIRALPLTATIDALRAIINEGHALTTLAPEIGVLAVWMIASFAVALKIFKWR